MVTKYIHWYDSNWSFRLVIWTGHSDWSFGLAFWTDNWTCLAVDSANSEIVRTFSNGYVLIVIWTLLGSVMGLKMV